MPRNAARASKDDDEAPSLIDQNEIGELTMEMGYGLDVTGKRKRLDSPAIPIKKLRSIAKTVDVIFTNDGFRYEEVEFDPNVYDKNADDDDDDKSGSEKPNLATHFYRIKTPALVTLSPNDRAYQLRMSDDHLTVTGDDIGYCGARATHSVAAGKWYYEVQLTSMPGDSCVRIGWSQEPAPLQVNVGYGKFSYGWRSKRGTKFHNSCGKKYYKGTLKAGDVLGCLISLPHDPFNPGPDSSKYLPSSGKGGDKCVINYKKKKFFEQHDGKESAEDSLEPLDGSYIEFFLNGVSCGKAYTNIYGGFYYPAVSLFHEASLRTNYGPSFAHPPPSGTRPMSERAGELAVHQSLADMIFIVEKNLYPSLIKDEPMEIKDEPMEIKDEPMD